MKASLIKLVFLTVLTATIFGCDKKEELEFDGADNYTIPLQPGKYITYKLDSTVFVQSGRQEEVHSYQEKHVVDAEIQDALGRKSFRIFRFLRNVTGTQPWIASGSYFITPLQGSVEVVENNLRVITLVGKVEQGKTWKGNRYLGTDPYLSFDYNFGNDDDIADWDFVIDKTGEDKNINGKNYSNVITVLSVDESLNVPIRDPLAFAARSYYVSQYAKNVGLIYQEQILWEYQPNPNGTPYKTGFGIKRTIIDHN
jgi:hypothetical protein